MATTTGTATGAADLFAKLLAFLSANGWTQVWNATVSGYISDQVVMQGTGSNDGDQVNIGIFCRATADGSGYIIGFNGMQSITANAKSITDHVNVQPHASCIYADTGAMTYWFSANTRRFMGVVQISTVFESFYAGWIMPYCLPTQYPNPMYVAGSCGNAQSSPMNWRSTGDDHVGVAWPYQGNTNTDSINATAYILDPTGSWRPCVGEASYLPSIPYATVTPSYWGGSSNKQIAMWDAGTNSETDQGTLDYYGSYRPLLAKLVPFYDGSVPLTDISIVAQNTQLETYGILDGMFRVSGGGGVSSGDTVTANSVSYLVAQEAFRTATGNYLVMALD